MKEKILVLIFCLTIADAFSQTVIENINTYSPPSPEAASLNNQNSKYGVDHYTGRLSYSVPLQKVDMGGHVIDIGFQYSTTGFKVQEVSSSIGLGWNASYLGVITRYVEGLPDDEANGYSGANSIGKKASQPMTDEYLKKATQGDWDSQPDKFVFSFPGYSGVFRLDDDGNPVFDSNLTGLVIATWPTTTGDNSWVIYDQFGNSFFFGDDAIETTEVKYNSENSSKTKTYKSSWYLKKIVNQHGGTINYEYIQGPTTSYTTYINVRRSIIAYGGCSINGPLEKDFSENVETKILSPLYLQRISNSSGVAINFSYANREDLSGGYLLATISIGHDGNIKRKFTLNHDYFVENGDAASKRLKLVSVHEGDLNPQVHYQFSYNEAKNLPARNSIKTDRWGYYNDNNGSSNIEGYLNSNKNPSLSHTMASVLVKVKNRTGGFVNFEYEQNNYYEGNQNVLWGGLRIKKTFETLSESSNAPKINLSEYSYSVPGSSNSSGQVYTTYSNSELRIFYLLAMQPLPCILEQGYKYSEPLLSIFDLNGANVGYTYVSITRFDGIARYKFTNYQDKPNVFDERKFTSSSGVETSNSSSFNLRPQLPMTSYINSRGKILTEELLDVNSVLVKKTNYDYDFIESSNSITGIKAFPHVIYLNNNSADYVFVRYKIFQNDFRLKKKIETFYKDNIQNLTKTEEYFYNSIAKNLIAKKSVITSNGDNLIETYRYPIDVSPNPPGRPYSATTAPITYMKGKNFIGEPLEVIRSFIKAGQSEMITSAHLREYKAINSTTVLPWKEYALEFTTPISTGNFQYFSSSYASSPETNIKDSRYVLRTVNSYNSQGRLNQKSTGSEPFKFQSYIWDGSGTNIIAEISNAESHTSICENFEEPEVGLGFDANVFYDNTRSHTGKYSGRIVNPNATELVSHSSTGINVSLAAPKKFTYSGWVYSDGPSAQLFLFMFRSGETGYFSYVDAVETTVVNQWVYVTKEFIVPADVVNIKLRLDNNAAGTVWFDDLRIQPSDAALTTYTYDPVIGMTSQTDAKGMTTYYEYDSFQRLKAIKDQDGNVVKSYDYHYKP